MDWSLLTRDVWLLLGATGAGFLLALATLKLSKPDCPVWPIRLYLLILSVNRIPPFRSYAARRTTFSVREQFFASWFVWFFVVFGLLIFWFPCPNRQC